MNIDIINSISDGLKQQKDLNLKMGSIWTWAVIVVQTGVN